jgi:outer membrane murein-binding lipoprotein Lpp
MRGLRQAPWRIQTQLTAAWAITLLTAVIVGGLYLAVASRTATAGRDVQTLEARKAELQLENDQLRAELATLRSLTRLQERARALGFQPAQAEQIEYLAVSTYPLNAHVPVPLVETAPPAPTLSEWLAEALTAIVPHWSR